MEISKFYTLPELDFEYGALAPYLSEEQTRVHHQVHHAAYGKGVNNIFEKMERSRKEGFEIDMKATLKELSFHIGGQILHSMYWKNICPANDGGGEMEGDFLNAINNEFGSKERFIAEFNKTALSVEGSGWAALTYCRCTERPLLMQIEKHNVNIYPNFKILMVLDMWEHAYYIDYKNDKTKYVEAFWKIVNWRKVEERFERIKA